MPRARRISSKGAKQALPVRLASSVMLLLALATGPRAAGAQVGPVIAGAVLGAAGGGMTALGLITAQARAGHYLYAPSLAHWQILPFPVGAVVGATLGTRSGDLLWATARTGTLGFLGGAAAGALVGRLIWKDSEGVWAGGVIGGASGLIVGSFVGALGWKEPGGRATPLFAISIPIG